MVPDRQKVWIRKDGIKSKVEGDTKIRNRYNQIPHSDLGHHMYCIVL